MHTIQVNDTHIVVTFLNNPDLIELETAILEEINNPLFAELNDIWVFGGYSMNVPLGQFYYLEALINKFFPENATRTKTAIVADHGLGFAIAEVWSSTTRLPYKTKIFDTRKDAEKWVTAPSRSHASAQNKKIPRDEPQGISDLSSDSDPN